VPARTIIGFERRFDSGALPMSDAAEKLDEVDFGWRSASSAATKAFS
jgi:hypothetical protein